MDGLKESFNSCFKIKNGKLIYEKVCTGILNEGYQIHVEKGIQLVFFI